MCEVANNEFNQGLGCTISMSDDVYGHSSKKGFLDSFSFKSRKTSKKTKSKEASPQSARFSIFAKKSTDNKKAQED